MSIVVFASFQVCNDEKFIREGKKKGLASFIPHVPTKAFKQHSTREWIQRSLQLLWPGSHAITGNAQAQAQCSDLPSSFQLRVEGQMGPHPHQPPRRKQGLKQRQLSGHLTALQTLQTGATDSKELCYWKGSSGASALCQRWKSPTWTEKHYAENIPEALN